MFGYHAVYEHDYENAIRLARQHGFDYVQFDLGVPEFSITELSPAEIRSIRSQAQGEGIGVTFHAPGDFLPVGIDTPGVRTALVEHLVRILEIANELESHHVTLHIGGVPSFLPATKDVTDFQTSHREYYQSVLSEDLRTLNDAAGTVFVTVENQGLQPHHTVVLQPLLNVSTHVRLCMDIPKLYTREHSLQPADLAFFTANRSMVAELHLHNRQGRLHMPVYEGQVDFGGFREWLVRDGIWKTIEVRPVELAARSLDWLRSSYDL